MNPETILRQQIEADLALAEGATAGPWTSGEHLVMLSNDVVVAEAHLFHLSADGEMVDQDHADAAFIARSRTAVPEYASALARVLDLADEWSRLYDETGALPAYVAELHAAVVGKS